MFGKRLVAERCSRWFLLLSLLFGVIFVFLIPPLKGFDEASHFTAINHYTDSSSRYSAVTPGSIKPVDLELETARAIAAAHAAKEYDPSVYEYMMQHGGSSNERALTDMTSSVSYPSLSYAPALGGLALAKLVHMPLLWQMYVARLSGLLVYVVLCLVAIRFMPFAKWGVALVALVPMMLFQATTVSADTLLNGLVILFAALVFYLLAADPMKSRQFSGYALTLLILGSLITLCKPSYVIITLLLLLLPMRHFGNSLSKKNLVVAGMLALFVVLAALWNVHTQADVLRLAQVYNQGSYVSSDAQIEGLLNHPHNFVTVAAATLIVQGYMYFSSSLGAFNGSYTSLPFIVGIPLLAAIWLTVLADSDKASKVFALKRDRRILALVLLLQTIAIGAIFYVGYTPVGSNIIEGIQGRYFTVLLILLLPLLAVKGIDGHRFKKMWVFPTVASVALIWSAFEIAAIYGGFLG